MCACVYVCKSDDIMEKDKISVLLTIKCIWTKYFMRSIDMQKYSKACVFSHVDCLSLSGFEEISEALFKAEKKSHRKGRTKKKKVAECIRTHVTRIELCY